MHAAVPTLSKRIDYNYINRLYIGVLLETGEPFGLGVSNPDC